MRAYKMILTLILVAAFVFGVWYCYNAYNEQRSTEKGTLVFEEYDRNQECSMMKEKGIA